MSLTYQRFRCWISHYIQKFLAPADNLIPIAVLLCPSMYHGSAEYLPGPASVFSISAFRSLCTSPLDHRHALLNVNSKRCDRQIPPTGAQQPPPFFSTGSPLHDFKDTATIDTPPPPTSSKTSQSLLIINRDLITAIMKPRGRVAFKTNSMFDRDAKGESVEIFAYNNCMLESLATIKWLHHGCLTDVAVVVAGGGGELIYIKLTDRLIDSKTVNHRTLKQYTHQWQGERPRFYHSLIECTADKDSTLLIKVQALYEEIPLFPTLSSVLPQPWLLCFSQAVSCLLDRTALWGAMACRACRNQNISEGGARKAWALQKPEVQQQQQQQQCDKYHEQNLFLKKWKCMNIYARKWYVLDVTIMAVTNWKAWQN